VVTLQLASTRVPGLHSRPCMGGGDRLLLAPRQAALFGAFHHGICRAWTRPTCHRWSGWCAASMKVSLAGVHPARLIELCDLVVLAPTQPH